MMKKSVIKDKSAILLLVGLCFLFYFVSALRLSIYEGELVVNIFSRGKIYIFLFGGLIIALIFTLFKESKKENS